MVVDLASRPGVPERLIVGSERAFLTWLYDGATARPEAIEPEAVEEYMRSFSGRAGVLGSMGIYRDAVTSIEQTEPLMTAKIKIPMVAMGGASKGLAPRSERWSKWLRPMSRSRQSQTAVISCRRGTRKPLLAKCLPWQRRLDPNRIFPEEDF